MQKRIADALLIRTGYAISAVVSIGEENEILSVCLFDTVWQPEQMRIDPRAKRIDLISHHPEGLQTLYDEDLSNFARLRRLSGGRQIRLYMASEYFPCKEIAIGE